MRIASLDCTGLPGAGGHEISSGLAWLRQENVDILCCRGIRPGDDERCNVTATLADELDMTSYYVAGGKQKAGMADIDELSGIAILCSHANWMLRSGSFSLSGKSTGPQSVGQYAVIRQQGNIILVLNLRLKEDQDQIAALAALPVLQGDFTAIILCGHPPRVLPGELTPKHRELKSSSGTGMQSCESLPGEKTGCIRILEQRQRGSVRLQSRNSRVLWSHPGTEQGPDGQYARGLCLDLDITSRAEKSCAHLYRYNSFLSHRSSWQSRAASCST